ncbi:MAG: hypothetical protein UY50_C0005G0019 [Parcubacteria group bacterium GW2011_GWA2_49_9]|nr:MAG: hypothetical protein UY50_C0005G0019 [Parcubacteria group bacterium GW2011_GWA2_49_9]
MDRLRPRYFRHVEFQVVDGEEVSRFHLCWVLHYFLHRALVRRLLNVHARRSGLKRIIFLRAHGSNRSTTKYCYFHGRKVKSVQDWIDAHDGLANALVVGACNCHNLDITAQHSIIIHPNCSWCLQEFMRVKGGGYIRVFVPGVGYVEKNYHLFNKVIDGLV